MIVFSFQYLQSNTCLKNLVRSLIICLCVDCDWGVPKCKYPKCDIQQNIILLFPYGDVRSSQNQLHVNHFIGHFWLEHIKNKICQNCLHSHENLTSGSALYLRWPHLCSMDSHHTVITTKPHTEVERESKEKILCSEKHHEETWCAPAFCRRLR